jgi:hypothetical protein
VADLCVSGAALVFFGGIGSILGGVIVYLGKAYIAALNQRAEDFKTLADRGNGQTRDALDIAKSRR